MARKRKQTATTTSNSSTFYGLEINEGDCLKVVFGKFCYYIQVLQVNPENPTVILGRDLYGKELVLRLTKALMVQRLPKEEYEKRKRW
ncbi:hypothetical protein DRN86_05205 [Candidatus Geothermarchaeota archaeon]|nr:MAG: hypothetical protein DRN86_05205 [Candidatus Geothermarchaeota archaeon]